MVPRAVDYKSLFLYYSFMKCLRTGSFRYIHVTVLAAFSSAV